MARERRTKNWIRAAHRMKLVLHAKIESLYFMKMRKISFELILIINA